MKKTQNATAVISSNHAWMHPLIPFILIWVSLRMITRDLLWLSLTQIDPILIANSLNNTSKLGALNWQMTRMQTLKEHFLTIKATKEQRKKSICSRASQKNKSMNWKKNFIENSISLNTLLLMRKFLFKANRVSHSSRLVWKTSTGELF